MTGKLCSHPLLGVRGMMEEMLPGETLLLRSDCPGTRDDLFSWAAALGNEVTETGKNADGMTEYLVRKGQRERSPPT